MGKTKPENPGLGGRLNPGFRFEKNSGLSGFTGKPGWQTLNLNTYVTTLRIHTYWCFMSSGVNIVKRRRTSTRNIAELVHHKNTKKILGVPGTLKSFLKNNKNSSK